MADHAGLLAQLDTIELGQVRASAGLLIEQGHVNSWWACPTDCPCPDECEYGHWLANLLKLAAIVAASLNRQLPGADMTEVFTYRVSFGQKYAREPHPRFSLAHPGKVLEIRATDYDDARAFVVLLLGSTWCDIYSPDSWGRVSVAWGDDPQVSCTLTTPAAAMYDVPPFGTEMIP